MLIPPLDLAVIGRREGCCQGSRCGRLAQPLTTFFPERSSSQVEWRVLLLTLVAGFGGVAVAMLPFALSRVLGLDSVHIGVRDVPVLQSTKRSQAAPAVPPRPATISQSPGLQRESLRGPAAGLSSSTVHFDGGSPFLGIVHYQRNYDSAPAIAPTAAARSAWYSG